MLTSLKIQNYALIKDIEVGFDKGLNIITGETGAGKSIIIGALNIAIGVKSSIEHIRTGEEKAIVEAVFDLSTNKKLSAVVTKMLVEAGIETANDTLVIKREINREARGRVFINNTASSVVFLDRLGKTLVDIHGQHEHQSLLENEIHINLLDAYSETFTQREEISTLFAALLFLSNEIKKLEGLEFEKQEKLDFINFRINEIEQCNFRSPGEFDDLMAGRQILTNTSAITDAVNNIIASLAPASADLEGSGAIDLMEKAKKSIADINKIDAKTVEQTEILQDAIIKAEEVKTFFVEYKSKIEFDPDRLKEIEDRIELIESLLRKYKKTTLKDIMDYYDILLEEKKKIVSNEELIKDKQKEYTKNLKEISAKAISLSSLRHKKAAELGVRIESELKDLGIGKGTFIVKVGFQTTTEEDTLAVAHLGQKYKLTALGIDTVEFMISLNPGEEVKPLVKVASGGEISRIMLAIKNILSDADTIPVMVFDEIDTGISGKIAQTVGKKLYEISQKKQLICITHLPQIAGFADTHYSVAKSIKSNKTETIITKLNKDEKIFEIAKLLSGETVTEKSMEAAKELIKTIKT
ncbi:MAG: DNA repair protein RecN [bacterium]